MGTRWLYSLPALVLSALAIVFALVGLSREPAPAVSQETPPTGLVMQVTEEQIEDALEHTYWVALNELSIGSVIEEEDFRIVGVSIPLPEALPSDELIAGKVLRRNIRAGEILATAHLEAVNRLARAVPSGFRAFAIKIDDVSAVGGMMKPGDLVDVVVHFRNGMDKQPTAMFLLNSIEVLAVWGELPEQHENNEETQQQRSGRNTTAVLAVPREDIPRLMVADANGSLRLALAGARREQKPRGDTEEVIDKNGEDAAEVVGAEEVEQIAKSELMDDVPLTLDKLFPEPKKTAPKRQAPARPQGSRVEVFEGSTSRSTYVH